MKIRIRHRTTYAYREPVAFRTHRLMLRPREGHDLHIESSLLDIVPAHTVHWMRDVNGNSIALVEFIEKVGPAHDPQRARPLPLRHQPVRFSPRGGGPLLSLPLRRQQRARDGAVHPGAPSRRRRRDPRLVRPILEAGGKDRDARAAPGREPVHPEKFRLRAPRGKRSADAGTDAGKEERLVPRFRPAPSGDLPLLGPGRPVRQRLPPRRRDGGQLDPRLGGSLSPRRGLEGLRPDPRADDRREPRHRRRLAPPGTGLARHRLLRRPAVRLSLHRSRRAGGAARSRPPRRRSLPRAPKPSPEPDPKFYDQHAHSRHRRRGPHPQDHRRHARRPRPRDGPGAEQRRGARPSPEGKLRRRLPRPAAGRGERARADPEDAGARTEAQRHRLHRLHLHRHPRSRRCARARFDYIAKPFTPEQIRQSLGRIENNRRLENRVVELESMLSSNEVLADFGTEEPLVQKLFETAIKAAASAATILLLGESGTGKSLLARALHQNSPRRDNAFVTVACPSLSKELLESELFGHVRGAFTGAVGETWGKVKAAEGGTLFLDEIGELPPEIQPKLLRLLQERGIRAGGRSQAAQGQRPGHRRHQPAAGGPGQGGEIPRGPLLPAQRHHHRDAAPAPAPARPPLARPAAS